MQLIKSLTIAAVAATMAGQATAGGFSAAVVEPIVVIPEPPMQPRSSFGIILPLVLLAGLIALAVSSSDEDEDDPLCADEPDDPTCDGPVT